MSPRILYPRRTLITLFLLAFQWQLAEAADCAEAIKPSNEIAGCQWNEKVDENGCKAYAISCGPEATIDKGCLVDSDSGPCFAHITRYYYNSRVGKCSPFVFGGCSANANNFNSLAECTSVCIQGQARKTPAVSFESTNSGSTSLNCTGPNEKSYECGACDSFCNRTARTVCSLICRPAECGCIDGYVRNSDNICVAPDRCTVDAPPQNLDPNAGANPAIKTTISTSTPTSTATSTTTTRTSTSTTTVPSTSTSTTSTSTSTLRTTSTQRSTSPLFISRSSLSTPSTIRTSTPSTTRTSTPSTTRISSSSSSTTTNRLPSSQGSNWFNWLNWYSRSESDASSRGWQSSGRSTPQNSFQWENLRSRTQSSQWPRTVTPRNPSETQDRCATMRCQSGQVCTDGRCSARVSHQELCTLITCPTGYQCRKGSCVPPTSQARCPRIRIAVPASGCQHAFRNDSQGCPLPYLQCANLTCGANEEAKLCGACDGTCGQSVCIPAEQCLRPSCGCFSGYVRNRSNKCVPEQQCPQRRQQKKIGRQGPKSNRKSTTTTDATSSPSSTSTTTTVQPARFYNFHSKVLNTVYQQPGPVQPAAVHK